MKEAAGRSSSMCKDPTWRSVMCSGNKTSGTQALNRGGVAGSEGRSGQGPDPVHLVDPISLLILITTLMRSSERV